MPRRVYAAAVCARKRRQMVPVSVSQCMPPRRCAACHIGRGNARRRARPTTSCAGVSRLTSSRASSTRMAVVAHYAISFLSTPALAHPPPFTIRLAFATSVRRARSVLRQRVSECARCYTSREARAQKSGADQRRWQRGAPPKRYHCRLFCCRVVTRARYDACRRA